MRTSLSQPAPRSQKSVGAGGGGAGAQVPASSADAWLFETPSDLICPITHELFRDPVINGAGQVYERAAIEHHLTQRATDPVTNAPLQSPHLIPVYTLKSRSHEFREHVAKACVDQACAARSCEAAARYLRRAAELVSGLHSSLKVPGLCPEVVEFLHAHPSNAYDAIALRIFADGLRTSGYVDQATQLYLRLVEHGEDRAQQASALRQCLMCLHGQDTQALPDKGALPFLAAFFESQHTFDAAGMLELLHEAKLPESLMLQLCEHLLTRRMRGTGVSTVPETGNGQQGTASEGLKADDLMFQYMQLRFGIMQRQLDAVHTPSNGHVHGHQGSAHVKGKTATASGKGVYEPTMQPGEQSATSPPVLNRLARFAGRRKRALASGVFVLLSVLGNSTALPVKLARAGGALLLVHCSKR